MKIAIRKNISGFIYIDKDICQETVEIVSDEETIIERVFSDKFLSQPPYNYKIIEVDDQYADCIQEDFNDDLTFNVDKYNARKSQEKENTRISELKTLLQKSDYKALKYAEGQITAEDYEPIKLQRQSWRDEIDRLGG